MLAELRGTKLSAARSCDDGGSADVIGVSLRFKLSRPPVFLYNYWAQNFRRSTIVEWRGFRNANIHIRRNKHAVTKAYDFPARCRAVYPFHGRVSSFI